MTIEKAGMKMCPFTETTAFHSWDLNLCITSQCMAWQYTKTKHDEVSRRNVDLEEKDKEGYCMKIGRHNEVRRQ